MKTVSDILANGFAGNASAFAGGGGGSGDVAGPASAVDNALARFDGTTGKLVQSSLVAIGDTGAIILPALGAEPSVPASGTGLIYARDVAGRILPKWLGPSGVDYPLQSHIGVNNVRCWRGGATTAATTFAATIGTMPYTGASPNVPTIPALAGTNLLTQTLRSTISTTAAAGSLAYIRGNMLNLWRGNAAGMGGFFVVHRFALSGTLQAGLRCFAGIVDVAANPTNINPVTPSTPGGIGLATDANSGNWKLVHNTSGTARTSIDLGASFPVNGAMMELALFCAPNDSTIGYRVTNWSTGAQASGTLSTNLPASTAFLAPSVWVTNNATAAAQTLDFVSTYVETDY